ncbi:MAG TPA: alpha/beta hydrolase [Clostridiales bacterium]|jgi:alpha-beta hydrolase superfamily lysophospholipase|nr:alpha/beta hydrolase [Clostridiales bacterium]
MTFESKRISNLEGSMLNLYKWTPEEHSEVIGIVQIAHGMAEWAGRYDEFASRLAASGYLVYANDHRGHGKTAKDVDSIGFLGKDSFNGMVRDLKLIHDFIKSENTGLPVYLFGHSMGSFLAQSFAAKYGSVLNGMILSGSNGKQGFMLNLGIWIAGLQVLMQGEKAKGKLLDRLTFGTYNKHFKPANTPFDWLSRDTAEVGKYIADPYCGGVFTASFFYDFFRGLNILYDSEQIDNIPKNLPIFILSGSMDPVGEFGKGVVRLVQLYHKHGLTDVSLKLYENARHEILNETNKDEVVEDILGWLNKKSALHS